MEVKEEMQRFTDKLMKTIQEHAEFTSNSLGKLDQHVDFNGKALAEESFNEINKMLYRVKDFEQVYNITQGKFRAREEDFLIKRSVNDVIEVIKSDVKKKNIDLTFNHGADLPNMAKADGTKFRQILLNVLEQTLQGTVKAGVKISTTLQNENGVPHLCVEVENTKGEKADGDKIYKMIQQNDFRKILESKVDINIKTAKMLANQMKWILDFHNAKTSKYSLLLPL